MHRLNLTRQYQLAFQKKELMVRTETEREQADGTHKKVKEISLTEKGRAFDPENPDA